MATRCCGAFKLPFVVLSCFFSMSAAADLQPTLSWRCATEPLQASAAADDTSDRKITLYEYKWLENCANDALPPDGTAVCRADYIKDGTTETLWLARNDRNYCRPRVESLVRDLQAAGFYCTLVESGSCEAPGEAVGDSDDETTEDPGDIDQEIADNAVDTAPRDDPVKTQTPDVIRETPDIRTETPAMVVNRSTVPIDEAERRDKRLIAFFDSLFDTSLAQAMADAPIPDSFDVRDQSTLSAANNETLRFSKNSYAWKTRRNDGVLVINSDFEHGASFNDVFFGFAFAQRGTTEDPESYEYRYIGVVSPETPSEVIYAGEDKIIISSKWNLAPGGCYASRTSDEYQWADSIYSTIRVRRISDDANPDCP